MAKWGEGDPRWIVEERADSHNVNNWHWKEVDANKWSEERLKDLLMAVKIEEGPYELVITKLGKCKGESMASNRKNRLITYWDYELEINFKVCRKDKETEAKGTIKIPNFSQENDIDDDVDLSSTRFDKGEIDDNDSLKFVKDRGHKAVRQCLKSYAEQIRSDFAAKVCQVAKQGETAKNSSPAPKTAGTNQAKAAINKPVVKSGQTSTTVGSKINTKKLLLTENFMCACSDFYQVFIDKQRVNAWSRGAQVYNPEKGGEFVLFNGNVTGKFEDLVENEKLVQKWRLKHWPAGHHSVATIKLTQTEKGTKMTLEQTGVPETDIERTKQGWKNFYWNPIKFTFGFGVEIS